MGIKCATEKSFMATVVEYARLRGWLVYHTYDSRRCVPGFPDLVLVRDGVIVFAELKVGKNPTTAEQDKWITALTRAVSRHVYVWYPEHWATIQKLLDGDDGL